MHELSVAQSIMESVREHPEVRGGRRVGRIGVRVGETSGVNAEALTFCFAVAAGGTDLEGAVLDVERIPVTFRCGGCAREFEPIDFNPRCPTCSSELGRLVGGDELALAYLELED